MVKTDKGDLSLAATSLTIIQLVAIFSAWVNGGILDAHLALAIIGLGLTTSGALITSNRWNYLQGWFWGSSGLYLTLALLWIWSK